MPVGRSVGCRGGLELVLWHTIKPANRVIIGFKVPLCNALVVNRLEASHNLIAIPQGSTMTGVHEETKTVPDRRTMMMSF